MLEKVQDVFRKVFVNDTLIITENTSANDISMWDSLTHMELITEIENAFGFKFTFQEVMNFNNVGDMLTVIAKKQNQE